MEREPASGMFYNWYDEHTGAKLTAFPSGDTVYPFLSTVDNGWFAAALMVVRTAEPSLRKQVDVLLDPMNFAAFYDAEPVRRHQAGHDARRLLGRPAQRGDRPGHDRDDAGVLHQEPLRHHQLRAADRQLHRHRPRPDPARALLRDEPHVPGQL